MGRRCVVVSGTFTVLYWLVCMGPTPCEMVVIRVFDLVLQRPSLRTTALAASCDSLSETFPMARDMVESEPVPHPIRL